MMTPGKRNYILLSLFDFLYLFARSSTMAFFMIWTTQHLGISATKTGLLYSVNAFIALLMQPFFGFISDKFGLKKRLIWITVAMLLPVGPFFIYLYAPLLVHSFWLGALLGGVYTGIIFNSGCGVIDSYIDKISRRYQFEYGRVRMWGSLGWAAAAWIVGKYIDSNPNLAFWLASIAIVIAALCFMLTKIELTEAEMQKTSALKVSHALELAKNGQFWMLLVFTLFVTQIYDTYDQQFAQYFSCSSRRRKKAIAGTAFWPPFRYAARRCFMPDAVVREPHRREMGADHRRTDHVGAYRRLRDSAGPGVDRRGQNDACAGKTADSGVGV